MPGTVAELSVKHIRPDMSAARPDWHMPEPRDVTVLGHRIRYWEKGAGKPLVLMHGFSGSAPFEWGRLIDVLAARHRVIALQCIGFAPSEVPDIAYSTEALVRHLGGFFAALDLHDITLVGESFGGWLVGSYAVMAAELGLPAIAKLCIVGGPVGQIRSPKPEAQGFVHAAVIAEVEAWWTTQTLIDHDPTRAKIFAASGLAKAELSVEAVRAIAVPVLLLWGDKDELIPLEIGMRAQSAIAGSQLIVFENIGHIPSVECPHEFVAAVDGFAGR